jgi:hypothetical protein
VQGALAGDQVLVELLRYRHYMGRNKWETRYGALVIASRDEPKWIPLGAAPAIEKNVELYRKSVRGDTDETTLHSVLRTLHDQVWAPIERALPEGTKTVILSPDGELNFISFATLLSAADEFLIEKCSIGYVASGRDLLREREASATELLAVFGNPDFGSEAESIAQETESSSPLAMRASEMRDFANMSLRALPDCSTRSIVRAHLSYRPREPPDSSQIRRSKSTKKFPSRFRNCGASRLRRATPFLH